MNWTQFASNPWIGFAGTLLGVVGIIISIILYYRSRKTKRPTVFRRSIQWFDGEYVPHRELSLSFRGKPIARFTITHIAFWNAGNDMFRASDFAPTSPLRVRIPKGIEVFDIRITSVTTPEIGACIQGSASVAADGPREVIVSFHYLDPNDGFAVQMIHDGGPDQQPEFIGKLPGVSGFREHSELSSKRGSFRRAGLAGFSYTSPVERFFIWPLVGFGLGSLGPLSIYLAIFHEYHWYHFFGFLCTFYLLIPFSEWSEPLVPKALCGELNSKMTAPNKAQEPTGTAPVSSAKQ